MEEAVEICKLRLFLKLVAQIERVEDIEPLPDIDFNIRAGNTLVGFANYDEVKRAVTSKLDFDNTMARIEEKAQDIDRLFALFRQQQTELEGEVTPEDKQELRNRLKVLEDELNRYLATEYGVNVGANGNSPAYEKWLSSHKPFHWFIEFYGIIKSGGFDVIIGNPPYVEYRKVRDEYTIRGYQTESCGNLYAFIVERITILLKGRGRLGVIIPVASVCTDGYVPLQWVLRNTGNLIISSFNDRPGKLFDGLEHIRLSIILCEKTDLNSRFVFTTKYNKWQTVERSNLFHNLTFVETTPFIKNGSIPKLCYELERSILKRLSSQTKTIDFYARRSGECCIYYTRKISGFIQILDFIPSIYDASGNKRRPSELKDIFFDSPETRDVFLGLLNSNLFYWFLTVVSDCRNLNRREVYSVPLDVENDSTETVKQVSFLTHKLMNHFKQRSKMLEMKYENLGKINIQCIYPKLSKPIIDEIDCILAEHYGFTDEELDFIINYDIKYRMGQGVEEESGE